MAEGSWLSDKLVVIFAIFLIPCAHSDDLLQRVRESKSSDPEVRSFLKSVLQHHEDFRWIQEEASRINPDDYMLPLRGLPLKKKRAFYSSRNGYPVSDRYGYRRSPSTNDVADEANVEVNRMDDIYPYENNVNEQKDSQHHRHIDVDNDLYVNDNKLSDDDGLVDPNGETSNFVEEDSLDEWNPAINYKRSIDSDYISEHQVPSTRNINTADLLKEKIMLHNILYNKDKNFRKVYIPDENLNVKRTNPVDAIEVLPSSEKGVLYTPGDKKFGVDSNEHDSHFNRKRECAESHDEHDFAVKNLFSGQHNDSHEDNSPLGEFYYSGPHDILGINQDVLLEQHDTANMSCKKYKKSARLYRSLLTKSTKPSKKEKSIKIRIFDDSKLVKDIQKGDVANSIVLTIKDGDAKTTKTRKADDNSVDARNHPRSTLPTGKDDNTLQSIDSILRHDAATLKINSQLPSMNAHKENWKRDSKMNESASKNDKHNSSKSMNNSQLRDKSERVNIPNMRLNEMGTRIAYNEDVPEIDIKNIDSAKDTQNGVTESQEKQNRLEDQTEPTSAAEQRELGRVGTSDLDSRVITEKIMTVSVKKKSDSNLKRSDYLRETKNLVNSRKATIADAKVREADKILGALKQDLKKSEARDLESQTAGDIGVHQESKSKLLKRKSLNSDISDSQKLDDEEDKDHLTLSNFKSRRLLLSNENKNEDEDISKEITNNSGNSQNPKNKRDLREVLGMKNDEDYSEDKVDNYGTDSKSNKRHSKFKLQDSSSLKKEDLSSSNKEDKYTVDSKQKFPQNKRDLEIRATKGQIKRTEDNSMAKLVENGETKLNLFTNNMDHLQKRESLIKDMRKVPGKNRCCTDDEEPVKHNTGNDNGANELDIIEKTQAILLHITNNPTRGVATTDRGDLDENDDPSAKSTDEFNRDNDQSLTVKRLDTFKISDKLENEKNEDVVGEILKIVNNFKNNANKNKKQLNSNENDDQDANPDVRDDDSFTAHHRHEDKKAHPAYISTNKCHSKPGSDDEDIPSIPLKQVKETEVYYSGPKEAKEGFITPDVVDKSKENEDKVNEEVDRVKRTGQPKISDENNPFRFTPDNLQGFKEIIENLNQQNLKEDSNENNEGNSNGLRIKRYLNSEYNDAVRSDDELDRLIALDKEEENSRRQRRYQGDYAPFFYDFAPRFKLQAKANDSTSTTSSTVATTFHDVFSQTPMYQNLKSCGIEELKKTMKNSDTCKDMICAEKHKKEKKKHNKGNVQELEYGNPILLTEEHDKKTKEGRKNEILIKQRTREKIFSDNLLEKQREQLHIKNVLNGHLMLDIIDAFQNHLKENERLKSRFGANLGKNCGSDEVQFLETFRDEQSKQDVRHAQLMLHQVIVMLNNIVADQVHRRTCMVLSGELRDFLKKLATTKGTTKSLTVAEGYPLPQIQGVNTNNDSPAETQGEFLFPVPPGAAETGKSAEINLVRKIHLIKKLLNKYNRMSQSCQVKVEPVKEYLADHLAMLERLEKDKKNELEDTCTVGPNYLATCLQEKAGINVQYGGDSRDEFSKSNPTTASTASTGEVTKVTKETSPANKEPATNTTTKAPMAKQPKSVGKKSLHENSHDVSNNDEPLPIGNHFFEGRNLYKSEPNSILDRRNSLFVDKEKNTSDGRKIKKTVSGKYRKLVDAADTYRRKRQIEERLARLFGKRKDLQKASKNGHGQVDNINDVAFETPLVYGFND